MRKTRKQKIIAMSWFATMLWMILIFALSAQPVAKSNGLSEKVTRMVVETAEKVSPKADFNLAKMNHLVRKNAHFFSYLVLGVLMANAFKISGSKRPKVFLVSFLLCVFYAISDEFHQLFVPGRGAQVMDVIIDSAGAMVGTGIYGVFCRLNLISKLTRKI